MDTYLFDELCDYHDEIEDIVDKQYYFGTIIHPHNEGHLLLDSRIAPEMFLKHTYSCIKEFSLLPINPKHIQFGGLEIVKINIIDQIYTVVIKTFWLRIIQRKWKRIMKEWIIKSKSNVFSLPLRRFPIQLPSCRGMLA
jgi:hypothetical protein